jgi:hypothetical protein
MNVWEGLMNYAYPAVLAMPVLDVGLDTLNLSVGA